MMKGEEKFYEIGINAKTDLSNKLDPDELKEDKFLGEGGFGIVYQGTFRGNTVVIKKMKEISDTNEQMEEFNNEVAMLDKFRCEYIIHFYGAVFMPGKICMVTELAPYGSVEDLIMKSHKETPILEVIRIKILYDAARGMEYLHNNGILHRDIKPGNILVFDVEHRSLVNGKLTDFGSSRNINMMMTNMTFTKGIGTPIYMAPEVLKHQHYKMSADIYSFAITMFETMAWDSAYSPVQFKFPWMIAEFVCSGRRLNKLQTMDERMYGIIQKCWYQDPNDRITATTLVEELKNL